MNTMSVFDNSYGIPPPENADDIKQLYNFKDALEEKAQEREDKNLQRLQRICTKRLKHQMKDRKKFFRVSKLICQKETDTGILRKLDELSADMLELKEDMEDVKSTLKRLCFNDAVTENSRRRTMRVTHKKVPFIVGDGPSSEVSSIQDVEMIDLLSLRNCQYLLAGYGEEPQSMTLMTSVQMKSRLRDILGFIDRRDIRFEFEEDN